MSRFISLRNSTEFGLVYKNGRSFANRYLVIYIVENSLPYNRYGISVSKKTGNSVVRHRLTRLIRETIRLSGHMFNSGLDIVVVARAGAKGKKYEDISSAFMHLMGLHVALAQQ